MIPWTVAQQAPLSMELLTQEYWSGLPFLTPGDLLNPGIEPVSFESCALLDGFFTTGATWETLPYCSVVKNPPANAEDVGSIPSQVTKIPHAMGKLESLCTATRKSPSATTKTQHSQNYIYIYIKGTIGNN